MSYAIFGAYAVGGALCGYQVGVSFVRVRFVRGACWAVGWALLVCTAIRWP